VGCTSKRQLIEKGNTGYNASVAFYKVPPCIATGRGDVKKISMLYLHAIRRSTQNSHGMELSDKAPSAMPEKKPTNILCRWISRVSWVYLVFLALWLALHLAAGDRFGHLALVNLLAVYLFLPLPVILLASVICRRTSVVAGGLMAALIFLYLWGGLFVPRAAEASNQTPALTVMTYNVLARHNHTQPILETIRAEQPDVVFIQELNTQLAGALQQELGREYPYQVLEAVDHPRGIGTISKYPLRDIGERSSLAWMGGPQVLEMHWQGRTITLVNFHMLAIQHLDSPQGLSQNFWIRAAEAQALVQIAQQHDPAILGGDANSTPLSQAHRILSNGLTDTWRQAGFGLGHTFPGSTIPGSDRPKIFGWYVPQWLARIDYIFASREWQTTSARVARFDGVSDHRGVVATLILK
jgi:vancomycin resistance protein VanJ